MPGSIPNTLNITPQYNFTIKFKSSSKTTYNMINPSKIFIRNYVILKNKALKYLSAGFSKKQKEVNPFPELYFHSEEGHLLIST